MGKRNRERIEHIKRGEELSISVRNKKTLLPVKFTPAKDWKGREK